ncbi:MAG TPA: DNA polymerase III subunit gamma/tau [Glaciecola sp.]|nr:DNA polymerase III subunit gamma/tau [Glaciecola sp.]
MSYQVLARKWRPSKFSELVGQEHVVTAISNALDNNRLHHAYLFTGTRGVGKTTIARIFAKSLNCESGLSANPCGQCGTCKDIEQGRFVDLLEIDAASRTKVDDTRELLDNVQYRPTQGDYKVYLIDEVHMLSKHSFNALLKTLEEPPPHVKFLLATTDPQKLPVTILSRCLQFNLKALSREQIQQQLSYVLTQEQINHEPAALAQLARAANGSMRDALSLTDQAIAQGNNQISASIVTDMLGLMDKNQILKMLHSLIEGHKEAVFEQVEALAQTAPNYANVLDELMSLLHQIAMTQVVPEACKLETISARAIYKLAGAISKEQVQLLYQMALQGKQDLPHSMDSRSGFEMVLLRMLAFTPATEVEDFVEIIKSDMHNHMVEVGEMVTFAPAPDLAPVEPAAVIEPISVIVGEPQENTEEKVDFSEVMNDMFAEPEPEPEPEPELEPELELEPEPEPQIESSPKIGSDPLLSELVDIMDEAAEMHPHQFDDSDLPPEAYMDNDDYSEVPIDVQVQQDSQPQVKAVSHDTLDDLLSLRDELSAPATTPEITPTVQLQTAEQESTEREPAELEIVPLPPVAPSSSANADESEEPSQPLAQPERDPSKMGLVHHEDMPAVNFQQVQAEQLTAILPNGDKLTSAAQIDEWANTISKLNLGGLNKQLAIHSAFQRNANTVTLLLDEQKGHLQSDAAIDVVCTALSNHFGEPINVNVTCGQPTHTPFSLQMQINQIRKAHAEAIFNSDPELQKLKNTFGASVVDGSLKPKP